MSKPNLPAGLFVNLWVSASLVLAALTSVAIAAVFIPLATTIHVSGSLISSQPDYQLQHPYGGGIAWVGIRKHQQVRIGDPLLRLNFQSEREALKEAEQQIHKRKAENAMIEKLLKGHDVTKDTHKPSDAERFLHTQYQTKKLRQHNLIDTIDHLKYQITIAQKEIALLSKRHTLNETQMQRLQTLRASSLIREAEIDLKTDQMLDLAAQVERRKSELAELKQNMDDTQSEYEQIQHTFETDLLERLHQNQSELSRLRTSALELSAIVATEVLTSPIDGHIHALAVDAELTYAPRGETLVTLARTLKKPRFRLTIPVSAIDQVYLDQIGKLTVTSLPQRDLPPIYVRITSISPLAERDQNGAPIGYSAEADLEPDYHDIMAVLLKDHRLSADMPISVSLTGRTTTVAEYILPPVSTFVSTAFQD